MRQRAAQCTNRSYFIYNKVELGWCGWVLVGGGEKRALSQLRRAVGSEIPALYHDL